MNAMKNFREECHDEIAIQNASFTQEVNSFSIDINGTTLKHNISEGVPTLLKRLACIMQMTNEPYDLDLNIHNASTPRGDANNTGINESQENISIPPEAYTDLDHANYLIAGLLLLVMIVLAIWIKFFLSWKKELDSTCHSGDFAPFNNQWPDEGNFDQDEPYKDIAKEDKNDALVEVQEKDNKQAANPESKQQRSYIDDVNVVMLNRS